MAAEPSKLDMPPTYWIGVAHDLAFAAVASMSPIPRVGFEAARRRWVISFSYAHAVDVVEAWDNRTPRDIRLTWSRNPVRGDEVVNVGCLYGYVTNASVPVAELPVIAGMYSTMPAFLSALAAASAAVLEGIVPKEQRHGHGR